jgi:hypothetical protein
MSLDTFYEEVHIDFFVKKACAIDFNYGETEYSKPA